MKGRKAPFPFFLEWGKCLSQITICDYAVQGWPGWDYIKPFLMRSISPSEGRVSSERNLTELLYSSTSLT